MLIRNFIQWSVFQLDQFLRLATPRFAFLFSYLNHFEISNALAKTENE
jgi:hypothetical protein